MIDAWHSEFGWRVWYLTETGRLASPVFRDGIFESLPVLETRDDRGYYVEAQCPHGHRIPSPDCPCGVHFIPALGRCLKWLASFEKSVQTVPLDGPWAFTFGAVDGASAVDQWPSLAQFGVRRALRYYPLGIAVPETHPALVDAVREHYGVLVTASTSEDRLQILERGVRAKLPGSPWSLDARVERLAAVLSAAQRALSTT